MLGTTTNLRIRVSDTSQVGSARRNVVQLCQAGGLGKDFNDRAALVTTELAQNLAIHTPGGELLVKHLVFPGGAGLEILALDTGPGIRNIADALRDGHSTAGTAGNGFGCIRRLSQEFEVFSQPHTGTAVWVRLFAGPHPVPGKFVAGAVSVALEGEDVCGDAWDWESRQDSLHISMVDGLGHGYFAHQAALTAMDLFRKNLNCPLEETLRHLDHGLKGTRGAAQAMVHVNLGTATVLAAGVGNISMRLLHESGARSMISENGTLGAGARRIREYSYPWQADSLLVLHSDGLSANWGIDRYPGLLKRHPALIAGIIYRDQHRERDDATVAVARQVT